MSFIEEVRRKKNESSEHSDTRLRMPDEEHTTDGDLPFFPLLLPSVDNLILKGIAWEKIKSEIQEYQVKLDTESEEKKGLLTVYRRMFDIEKELNVE